MNRQTTNKKQNGNFTYCFPSSGPGTLAIDTDVFLLIEADFLRSLSGLAPFPSSADVEVGAVVLLFFGSGLAVGGARAVLLFLPLLRLEPFGFSVVSLRKKERNEILQNRNNNRKQKKRINYTPNKQYVSIFIIETSWLLLHETRNC